MDAVKIQEVCRPKTFQVSWEVTPKQIPQDAWESAISKKVEGA